MSKGRLFKDKPRPPARDVFHHGIRFLRAEERLRQNTGQLPMEAIVFSIPSNVMAAFAIELFLKSLIIMDGGYLRDTHHLGKLFSWVDNKKKDHLSTLWSTSQVVNGAVYAAVERHTGVKIPAELQKVLDICGEPFVDLRYHYEDTSKGKFVLSELPRILFDYVLEVKPEWR